MSLTVSEDEKLEEIFSTPVGDYIYYAVSLPYTLYPASLSTDADSDSDSSVKKKKKGKKKSVIQLKITLAYVHLLSPLPKQIKKSGKQYVTYTGNLYFFSPYPTSKLGVKFVLASDKIKSSVKDATSIDNNGKKIGYGPFTDLNALAYKKAYFHFEFNVPYLTMTEVVRDIEISHWGNVRVEESFNMQHDGARLKGPFEPSMMDRMRGNQAMAGMTGNSDPAAVQGLRAYLPKNANNVAYVDRIGNISTSNFRNEKSRSVLEIRPRYPLYGGWKTDFVIGYDVPAQELISINSQTSVHTLNVSFGIPFKEPVTNSLIVRVALPEGAHDIQIHSPYDIDIESDGNSVETEHKRFTYLDSRFGGGRPLIVFTKKNVVSLHSRNFQISYVYDETRIYFKPALIMIGIFLFLSLVMFLSRINPSLDDGHRQIWGKKNDRSDTSSNFGMIANSGEYNKKNNNKNGGNNNAPDLNDRRSKRNARELVLSIDVKHDSVADMIATLTEARKGDMENGDIKQKIRKALKKAKKYSHVSERVKVIVSDLQAQLQS
jgi:oligosaccharyltransferase complex subunit alpha (ribophorin I)